MKHPLRAIFLRWSPDGRFLFVWCAQQRAYVWDTRTGRLVTTAPFVPGFTPSTIVGTQEGITFNVRGDRALTGSTSVPSQQVPSALWDLRTGEPVHNVLQPLPVATSPEFSPDGNRFATNGAEPRIWDAASAAPLTPLLEHGAPVNSVAFSPNGRLLVTASSDSTARIWNAASGKPVSPPLVHAKAVLSASFSADGLRVVTGAADGTLRVWDAATGEALTPPWKQTSPILHVRFTADSRHVIAAGEKETRVWDLPVESRSSAGIVMLAELVSGQRMDSLVGVTNADPALIQRCWEAIAKLPAH
jgi:WD40 repeat protein